MAQDDVPSRRERRARKALIDDFSHAMAHQPSRRVLRYLIDSCGVYRPDTPEDRRRVGLEIISILGEVGEHAYVGLMKEGADELVALKAKGQEEVQDDV